MFMPISAALKKQLLNEVVVNANNQGIGDSDIPELITLIEANPRLTQLNLSFNKLADIRQLFPLFARHPSLSAVDIGNNGYYMDTKAIVKKITGYRTDIEEWGDKCYTQEVPIYTTVEEIQRVYISASDADIRCLHKLIESKNQLAVHSKDLSVVFEELKHALRTNSPDFQHLFLDANDLVDRIVRIEEKNKPYFDIQALMKIQLREVKNLLAQSTPAALFDIKNIPFRLNLDTQYLPLSFIADVLATRPDLCRVPGVVWITALPEIDVPALAVLCEHSKYIDLNLDDTPSESLNEFLSGLLQALKNTKNPSLQTITCYHSHLSDSTFALLQQIATITDVLLRVKTSREGEAQVASSDTIKLSVPSLTDTQFNQLFALSKMYKNSPVKLNVQIIDGMLKTEQLQGLIDLCSARQAINLMMTQSYHRQNCEAIIGLAAKLHSLNIQDAVFYPSMVQSLTQTLEQAPNIMEFKLHQATLRGATEKELQSLANAVSSRKQLRLLMVGDFGIARTDRTKFILMLLKSLVHYQMTTLHEVYLPMDVKFSSSQLAELDELLSQLVANNRSLQILDLPISNVSLEQLPQLKIQLVANTTIRLLSSEDSFCRQILARNGNQQLLSQHAALINDLRQQLLFLLTTFHTYLTGESAKNLTFNQVVDSLFTIAKKIDSKELELVAGKVALRQECQAMYPVMLQSLLKSNLTHAAVNFNELLRIIEDAIVRFPAADIQSYMANFYANYLERLKRQPFADLTEHYKYLNNRVDEWLNIIAAIRKDDRISPADKQHFLQQYYGYFARVGWPNENVQLEKFRNDAINDLFAVKSQTSIDLAITYIRTQVYYTILNQLEGYQRSGWFNFFKTDIVLLRKQLSNQQTDASTLAEIIDTIIKKNRPLFRALPDFIQKLQNLAEMLAKLRSELKASSLITAPIKLADNSHMKKEQKQSEPLEQVDARHEMIALSVQYPPTFSSIDDVDEGPAATAATSHGGLLILKQPALLDAVPLAQPQSKPDEMPPVRSPNAIAPRAVYFPTAPQHEPEVTVTPTKDQSGAKQKPLLSG